MTRTYKIPEIVLPNHFFGLTHYVNKITLCEGIHVLVSDYNGNNRGTILSIAQKMFYTNTDVKGMDCKLYDYNLSDKNPSKNSCFSMENFNPGSKLFKFPENELGFSYICVNPQIKYIKFITNNKTGLAFHFVRDKEYFCIESNGYLIGVKV